MRDATYWDGNGGIVTFAISALDMALWDLKGRIEGRSLTDMLGGAKRDRLRACASTIYHSGDLDRIAQEFAGFREQGYTDRQGRLGPRPGHRLRAGRGPRPGDRPDGALGDRRRTST